MALIILNYELWNFKLQFIKQSDYPSIKHSNNLN